MTKKISRDYAEKRARLLGAGITLATLDGRFAGLLPPAEAARQRLVVDYSRKPRQLVLTAGFVVEPFEGQHAAGEVLVKAIDVLDQGNEDMDAEVEAILDVLEEEDLPWFPADEDEETDELDAGMSPAEFWGRPTEEEVEQD